jgi:hypothetical protein
MENDRRPEPFIVSGFVPPADCMTAAYLEDMKRIRARERRLEAECQEREAAQALDEARRARP